MPSYADVGLSDEEAAYQLAHLDDTKAPSIIASVVLLALLATIAVGLRLAIRWKTKTGFKIDDYLIIVAGVRKQRISLLAEVTKANRSFCVGAGLFVHIMVRLPPPRRVHAVGLTRLETRDGLGMHILAGTPERFQRLLEVVHRSPSDQNRSADDG